MKDKPNFHRIDSVSTVEKVRHNAFGVTLRFVGRNSHGMPETCTVTLDWPIGFWLLRRIVWREWLQRIFWRIWMVENTMKTQPSLQIKGSEVRLD